MSEGKKSFWAGIPGLITGIAGLLTGVVGLGTLAVQQGIVGDGNEGPAATTVTAPAAGGGPATTADAPGLTVDPLLVKLGPAERDKTVTVKNTATIAAITVRAPTFSGADPSAFRADAGCTNVRLEPGRSCTMKVLYTPTALLKAPKANLVLQAEGVTRATEVPIETSLI